MSEVTDRLDAIIWQNSVSIFQQAGVLQELRKLNRKEVQEMAAIDDVRSAVGVLRQNDADIKQAVADLAGRLGNNPSEAELAQIATDLAALGTSGAEVKPALDALDPDVPNTGITAANITDV